MESDSDSEEDYFAPKVAPGKKKMNPVAPRSLPVQLTWKGVQIYFPSVVLTNDLKVIADEALKQRIAKESSSSSSRPSSVTSTTSGDDKKRKPSTSSSTIVSAKSSSSSKYLCGICRSPFRSEYALKSHANVHSNSDDIQRKYGPCKCGGRFYKKSQFVNHTKICFVAKSAASAASRMEIDDVDVSPIRVKFEASEVLNSSSELENNALPPMEQEPESEQVDYVVTPSGSDIHYETNNTDDWEGGDQIPVVTSVSSIASNAMKCNRCGTQFSLNIQFQHHNRSCAKMCQGSATRRFACKYCPWKFNSIDARNRHHRSHEGARPYQCSTCLERFIRKDYMINHQATCTVTAATSAESSHNVIQPDQTSSIKKKTEQITASPGPELVSPSSSAFNVIKSGLDHLDNSSPGTYSGVRCEQCLRTFSAMRYLRQHVCRPHKKSYNLSNNNSSLIPMNLIMSSPNDIVCVCPFCGVKFSNSSGRIKHMRSQHKCEKCGQDFMGPSDRMKHSQTCRGIPPPHESDLYAKYKCYFCHEAFSPTDLSRHVLICQGDDADKDNASASSHNIESSNHLQVSDKFKCDLCGEMFSDSMELSRHCLDHVLSHSKLKNQPLTQPNETLTPPTVSSPVPPVFKCKFPTCSVGNTFRMFSHEEDLWFHVDKKHKSVGNICCGQCGEAFESEELVLNHEERFHIAVGVAAAVTASPKKQNNKDLEDSKESALAILSLDIARVLETSPDGSTPSAGPSRGMTKSVSKPISSSSGPKTKIKSRAAAISKPLSHLPVVVKKELETYQNLDEDNSHFEEDTTPNYAYNESQIPEGFLSHMLVPEKVGKEPLNPYVFISSECRALADAALEKATHLKNLNLTENSMGEEIVAFTCHVCSAVGVSRIFSSRSNYRLHLYYHRKTGRTILKTPPSIIPEADEYFCKICNNRKFTTRSNYIGHLKYHQQLKRKKGFDEPIPAHPSGLTRPDIPIQSEYTCSTCQPCKIFKDRKPYIVHLNYHERVKRDQDKKIRRKQLMRPDIPVSTTGEYFCMTCDNRKFTDRIAYIGHVQYHEKLQLEGKDRPIALGPLSKARTATSMEIPFSDVYTCEICENREFTERSAWISHLKYHQKIKIDEGQDRPIASTPLGAKRHLRRPDIPISDVYTCDQCEDKRTFTIRRDYLIHLSEHKRLQQKSLKSNWRRNQPGPNSGWVAAIPFLDEYKCETCPNHVFTNRTAYIGHIQYHRILQKRGRNRVILTKEEWIQRKNCHTQVIPDGQEKYECEICSDGRSFASKPSYISHLMYHEKLKRMGINRPLKKRWEKSTDNTIPESDSYTCTICEDRTFTNRFLYSQHLTYHKKIRLQEGKDRSIRTDWRELRKRNSALSQVPDALTYTCDICNDDREFTNKNSYVMHMAYHKRRADQGLTGPLRRRGAYLRPDVPILDIYTCNRCDTPRTFLDRRAFINHDNYHNIKEKQPKRKSVGKRGRRSSFDFIPFQSVYICKQCIHLNKTFTDRKKYILHLNYHKKQTFTAQSEDNTRNYSYSSSTLSMDYHDSHISDFMTQQADCMEMPLPSGGNVVVSTENLSELDLEDKFCCTRCGSDTVFTSRERYEEHMKEHRAMKKKNFQCSICEKAFSNIWNLKSHAKTHTGEKNFVCGDCGIRFVENFQLQRHQANDCKKVPCKYTCHCGDKFHSVDGLEEHVKKDHTETKVTKIFRCYVCNDQFLQAFELDQHVRENHPVDYAEFMQHKLEKQQQRTEAAGGNQNPDEGDEDDFEPLYPEVLMACEDGDEELSTYTVGETMVFDKKEEYQYNSAGAAGVITSLNENENANETTQEDGARTIGGAGWNFIPGLTGEIGDNDDDSESSYSDEEFTPESFEPEDVDVPEVGGTLGNPNHNNNIIPIDSSSYPPPPTVNTGLPPAPKTRRRRQSVDEDWTPSREPVQDHDDDTYRKRKRTYAGDGQFRCGYCNKTSHRIAYIKTHSSIHAGLPFKYIDLTGQSPQPTNSRIAHIPNYASSSVAAPQPTPQPVRPLQYVRPQQILPAPVVATIPPLPVTMRSSRTSSNDDGDGTNRQKAGPSCNCIFEDTALGYHKRCTGETCKCYTKYKGCSEQCDCKGSCGNPYFRVKALVPPSALPCSAALATLAGSPQVQAPVNVYSAANTILDIVNSTIEEAFHRPANTPWSLNPVLSTSTPLPFGDQPHNNSEQQVRTLGNVTGYANPVAASPSTETITLNSLPISILSPSLTSNTPPVMANVQPTPNATLGANRIISISSLTPLTTAQLLSSLTRVNPTYSTSSNTFRIAIPTNANNSPIYRIENQTNNVTPPKQFLSTPIPTAAESQSSSSLQNNVPANNSMIYRCFCHKDFNTLTSFLIHQWNHNEEKLFLCPICKRQFSSVNFLIMHAKKHVEVENISMVPCPACDRLLASNQEELDHHFTSCHASLICDVCQKFCATLSQLTSHRLSHGVCSICGLTFFNQTAMRNHLARDHPNVNPTSVRVDPLPPTATSRLTTASISTGMTGSNEPEVVTLIDLGDDDDDVTEMSPPSPEMPIIVSVAANYHEREKCP